MKLCRFQDSQGRIAVGLASGDDAILDLTAAGVPSLTVLLESNSLAADLEALSRQNAPQHLLSSIQLLAPVEHQEIWAAGVTYLRSKTARMEESDFSASAYDRVYDAARPELFFKSLAEKVVGLGAPVGIRRDSRWSVPEPELALVINSRGAVVGCTIGNDMSSRDIEGENLLYLPQAKIYSRSCAIGPFIRFGVSEEEVRGWRMSIQIRRQEQIVFTGHTEMNRMKRSFDELAGFLFRSQVFPHGAVLLTGTGVVPPDSFTLQEGDVIRMELPGVGVLSNPVVVV
ncbi:MAG: fumarylacetoacetate hydrolase family protein [Verrucomicrobiia bacterium]